MSESKLDKLVSAAIAMAALAIAIAVVKRSFFPATATAEGPPGVERAAPVVDSWREALPIGISLAGDSAAPVTIVEFSDLECPACRGFHEALAEVSQRRQQELRLIYVAFPLPSHRFAMPAARAMECADSLGRAREWADVVYASQDSLGLVGWGALALRAGISDTGRIARCATTPGSTPRIDAGLALGEKHGITATPTFWVNGVQLRGAIPAQRLDSLVMRMARESGARR